VSWREPVLEALRRAAPQINGITLDDSLSLLNDLGLSSRQLVELSTHIDRAAGRRVPTEEWLVDELSGERSQIGGLIEWLDTNYPRR
jgi:acyl carrier protein